MDKDAAAAEVIDVISNIEMPQQAGDKARVKFTVEAESLDVGALRFVSPFCNLAHRTARPEGR